MKLNRINIRLSKRSGTKFGLCFFILLLLSLNLSHAAASEGKGQKCNTLVTGNYYTVAETEADQKALQTLMALKRNQSSSSLRPKARVFKYKIEGQEYSVSEKLSNEFNVSTVFRTVDGQFAIKDYGFDKSKIDLEFFYRELLLLRYFKEKGIPILDPIFADANNYLILKPYVVTIHLNFQTGQLRSAKLNEMLEAAGIHKSVRFSKSFIDRLEVEIEKVLAQLQEIYYNNLYPPRTMLTRLQQLFMKLKEDFPEAVLAEDIWLLKSDYYNPGNLVLVLDESRVGIKMLDP